MRHFVRICAGRWVNPSQVCYVREDKENPGVSYIGFHGGVESLDDNDDRSNELIVPVSPELVVTKLEVALQEDGI